MDNFGFSIELLRQLWSNDFNRGYITASVLILGLLVALLILRTILALLFRTHRCTMVTVKRPDGDLMISAAAVADTVRRELKDYPQFEIRKIQLYRRKADYIVVLYCGFNASDGRGIPELSAELKPRILDAMKHLFGIERIVAIKFNIEKVEASGAVVDTPFVHVDSGL